MIVADTLREHPRPGSNSNGAMVAAPLTKDSASGERVGKGNKEGCATIGVAYPLARRGRNGESELEVGEANVYNALRAGDGGSSRLNQLLDPAIGVRRLTPIELERLQGLPDGWTQLDAKTPDSRRYSALGDAVTATVAEWIGRRFCDTEAAW